MMLLISHATISRRAKLQKQSLGFNIFNKKNNHL